MFIFLCLFYVLYLTGLLYNPYLNFEHVPSLPLLLLQVCHPRCTPQTCPMCSRNFTIGAWVGKGVTQPFVQYLNVVGWLISPTPKLLTPIGDLLPGPILFNSWRASLLNCPQLLSPMCELPIWQPHLLKHTLTLPHVRVAIVATPLPQAHLHTPPVHAALVGQHHASSWQPFFYIAWTKNWVHSSQTVIRWVYGDVIIRIGLRPSLNLAITPCVGMCVPT